MTRHSVPPSAFLPPPPLRPPPRTVLSSTRPPRCSVSAPHGVDALDHGSWFKLICGASTSDSPIVRNLSHIYTLAGVDCIDVAADSSTIRAAVQGIDRALDSAAHHDALPSRPLLMISVSDAHDVHFRKARFDPTLCPSDCPRPCERVCPADAILPNHPGVIESRCYGCGRCIPVCPLALISAHSHVHPPSHIRHLLPTVDALEIHTGPHRLQAFLDLWDQLQPHVSSLRVLAISLPDLGDEHSLLLALSTMWHAVRDTLSQHRVRLVWQTDGRPMSGDLAPSTAHSAVRLATKVRRLLSHNNIGGYVQLAGGTNYHTASLLLRTGVDAAGVAMGGHARKVILEALGEQALYSHVLLPHHLQQAVRHATSLVSTIKLPQ